MSEQLLQQMQEIWDEIQMFERARGNAWLLRQRMVGLGVSLGYPYFNSDDHLDLFRAESRLLARQNTFARGAIKNIVSTVLGGAGKFTVTSEDSGIKKAIEEFLTAWNTTNNWFPITITRPIKGPVRPCKAAELVRRLIIEGDTFIRFFNDDSVGCVIRYVASELVRNPQSNSEGYHCGILCDEDDAESVKGFYVYKDHEKGSFVSIDDMLHVLTLDTDSNVKRGLPELAFEVGEFLRLASEVVRATSIGARERAKIVRYWQHKFADVTTVSSLAEQFKAFQITHLSGRTDTYSASDDGQTVHVDPGREAVDLPEEYAEAYLKASAGALRASGAGLVLPEFIMSGDASNNNFASIKESGTPYVRSIDDWQSIVRTVSIRLGYEAISRASLPLEGYILGCELPVPTQRDSLEITREDDILITKKIKSRKTTQLERGLSPEEQRKNIAEEEKLYPDSSITGVQANGGNTASANGKPVGAAESGGR